MHYDEFRAMNSAIVLAASGHDVAAIQNGFTSARELIRQSEQRFTRFTEVSELAELNRSAGVWFQASIEMFAVLQEAYRLAVETDGIFNPAILPELKRAGYDRSMDELRNEAPRNVPVSEMELQDFREVQLDPDAKTIRMPVGMQLDLGGIAKGWIAEQAAQQLAQVSEACAVSAGGDMVLINLPHGESGWEVGLENPMEPQQDLAVLTVPPGAVATSSITKRRWQHNAHQQHHLIDPRTGKPAETEWLSTTVWAETAAEAEVYAKVLLIDGKRSADKYFDNQSEKAYLAVDKSSWVHGSRNYHEVFHV